MKLLWWGLAALVVGASGSVWQEFYRHNHRQSGPDPDIGLYYLAFPAIAGAGLLLVIAGLVGRRTGRPGLFLSWAGGVAAVLGCAVDGVAVAAVHGEEPLPRSLFVALDAVAGGGLLALCIGQILNEARRRRAGPPSTT
jgi:hypothetical protein